MQPPEAKVKPCPVAKQLENSTLFRVIKHLKKLLSSLEPDIIVDV